VVAILAAILVMPVPASAFQTPLSDESIREAYFLGQRHDDMFARFLDSYTQHLSPPKAGPYVSEITFLTPFALLTQLSSQHTANYSAQQAQLDHRGQKEYVRVVVQIFLTDSYGPYLPAPDGARPGSAAGIVLRPSDFWKGFEVRVFSEDKALRPLHSSGEPNYICSRYGGCSLTGATLYLDFPADSFDSNTASVEVYPPEGDPLAVDFDLAALR
jgi:hypothetical protein